ncbi:reverse transcriptase domain-containing protein [Tanacetum coccineum]
MNEFCGLKGIKREFSVARTPQQNGVAERKNKTLIEVARTMLTDSLLPTVFWDEAVNTACYVLNRVLVTKPHNKTPYELIIGGPPSISFMRPFGCPVTILNTLDPLYKFDEKAEEGFLVGYKSSDETYKNDTADDAADETPVQKPASKNEQALKNVLDKMMDQDNEASEKSDAVRKEFEAQCNRELLQWKATKASSTNSFNTVSTPVNAASAPRTSKLATPTPTEGYEEATVIPEINADHFEIKTNLLQLVQANPFHGFERENPHTHINNFKRITSTLKFRDVPNDVIKLMMFPYSLEGAARVWYDKEPPNSILTWEDLVTKFVNQFFPPSKTTHLKNEISRFTQKFEETFSEAWERFKEMLRACPHHGFTELTQVDTFYNGLNDNDQDSLNAAAGGNLLSKTTREALNIIENKSKVRYSRNKSNVSRMNTTSSSKTDERIDKLADQI